MSLVEDAKQAYVKDQLEDKKDKERETIKFVEDGLQNIKERFGDNLNIDVVSDKEGIAFLVDGLKMRVRKSQGYYSIYLVQICPKCNTEYEDIIINLKTIGKSLQEGHTSYECEKILKDREVKELTTEEKLVDALRNFIQENTFNG